MATLIRIEAESGFGVTGWVHEVTNDFVMVLPAHYGSQTVRFDIDQIKNLHKVNGTTKT